MMTNGNSKSVETSIGSLATTMRAVAGFPSSTLTVAIPEDNGGYNRVASDKCR